MIHKMEQAGALAYILITAKKEEEAIVLIPVKTVTSVSVVGAITKLEATNYIADYVKNNAAVWEEVTPNTINPAMTALRIEAAEGTAVMVTARIID